MSAERVNILILGAGPAGLGAAWRLRELGRSDWLCLERDDAPGGLSRSFRDRAGFTWDLGGHIVFSRLERFNRMLEEVLPGGCLEHERRAFIRLAGSFIPYPFQSNLHHLPPAIREECLKGLAAAAAAPPGPKALDPVCTTDEVAAGDKAASRSVAARPAPVGLPRPMGCRAAGPAADFAEWVERSFGAGISRHFMGPYNRKLWCCELSELSADWVGERVARPDPARILQAARAGRDETSWGPNRTFRFPRSGGTGAIWTALAGKLPSGLIRYGAGVVAVDLAARRCRLADGGSIGYQHLIATGPLDELARMTGERALAAAAEGLRHNSVKVFGLGLAGRAPAELADKCWVYFPEEPAPFYRLTVPSNYSPENVPPPDGERGESWSLLLEVAFAPPEAAEPMALWPPILGALRAEGLLPADARIVSPWHRTLAYAYPLPSAGRDRALAGMVPALERRGVWPRGRFGAWRYEVGNMDHCFLQGVEAVERILDGRPETLLPPAGGPAR